MLRALFPLGWFTVAVLAGLAVAAQETLYDEKADAPQQVATALAEAAKTGKNVILVYGANW